MTSEIRITVHLPDSNLAPKKRQHLIQQVQRLAKRSAVRVNAANSTEVAHCLERLANVVAEVPACAVCVSQDAQPGKTRCVSCEVNGW